MNVMKSVVQKNGVCNMPHNGKTLLKDTDCGYQKRFKYNIDMNSNGILGECIDWCETNCKSKWGWWFEGPDNPIDYYSNHWENQKAWMSFDNDEEATAFLLAVGIKNMGKK